MKNETVTIKIKKETHKEIKIRCAYLGISIQDYIALLVKHDDNLSIVVGEIK